MKGKYVIELASEAEVVDMLHKVLEAAKPDELDVLIEQAEFRKHATH